jgi:HK97 family phage portal protein
MPDRSIQVITYDGGSALSPAVLGPYGSLAVPAYFRAISLIADNIASFPRSVRKDGAKADETKSHPVNVLLRRRPNGYGQNPFILFRTWVYAAAHTGNGYLRIERDPRNFRPIALHNLKPEDVCVARLDQNDGAGLKTWYLHLPTKTAYPSEDIAHLQGLGHDGIAGMDPTHLHSETFQHGASLTRYQVRFLLQGTCIRGFVSIPAEVSDETIEQIQALIRKFYRGPEAERDVLVLSGGAQLSNTTITPQDSQLAEQVSGATKAISQITGVAPELLFERSESKYVNTVEQVAQDFVKFCLRSWITQAETELTLKLLTSAEQDQGLSIAMNVGALLRGDTAAVAAAVNSTVAAGVRTPNEGRDLLDLPPSDDPEADKLKRSGDNSPPQPPTAPAAQ